MGFKCADPLAGGALELRLARVGVPGYHVWPHSMVAHVNDTQVAHVEPPKEGHARRGDVPIQIELVGSPQEWRLEVQAELSRAERATEFVLCLVQLTAPRALRSLLADCLAQPEVSVLESAELLHRVREEADSEAVCATPWAQPLLCPLSQERINVPARGVLCRHLRCFDLEAYLKTSSRAAFQRRWRCPVCDLPLRPAKLVVCGLTTMLLEKSALGIATVPLDGFLPHPRQASQSMETSLRETTKALILRDQSAQAATVDSCRDALVASARRPRSLDNLQSHSQPQGRPGDGASSQMGQVTCQPLQHVEHSSSSAAAAEAPSVPTSGCHGKRRRCWQAGVLAEVKPIREGEASLAASWGRRLWACAGPRVVFDL